MVKQIDKMILDGRQHKVRELADMKSISKSAMYSILIDHLNRNSVVNVFGKVLQQ